MSISMGEEFQERDESQRLINNTDRTLDVIFSRLKGFRLQ